MNKEPMPSGSGKRHEQFRNFGAYGSFAEADAEVRAYWWSRTPAERMEALEELRIRVFGQAAIDSRVERVFGSLEPHSS
jgi:hypothetical protein